MESLHEAGAGAEAARTRAARLELLTALTGVPTAAGREGRAVEFVRKWAAARPLLALHADSAGNLVIAPKARNRAERKRRTRREFEPGHRPPLYITAHLDHPAFVVERVVAPGVVEASFRGGVMDVFFENAPVTVHAQGGPVGATLAGVAGAGTAAGKHYLVQLDSGDRAGAIRIGDIATWRLPGPEIDAGGVLHAPACDDLAAAAAALNAIEEIATRREAGQAVGDTRLLLTRAEEIGFVGAIAACKAGTMARGARVITLENSRAFADCPIGGGPIVRVGDRLSVFTPWLTRACAERAERVFGRPSQAPASQAPGPAPGRPWQRKLMPGGACEATVFCAFGYDATCLCLALGNYHNMPHLDALQSGAYDAGTHGPPRAVREQIHTEDYLSLVDLLVALGMDPPEREADGLVGRLEGMYTERAFVLGAAPAPGGKARTPRKSGTAKARR